MRKISHLLLGCARRARGGDARERDPGGYRDDVRPHRIDAIARGSDTAPRRVPSRVPPRLAAVEKPPGVFIRNARSMTHLPLKLASLAALLGAIISLTLASVSVPVRLGVRDDARAPSKFSSPAMSTLGTALSLFPLDDRSVVFAAFGSDGRSN